MKISADKLE